MGPMPETATAAVSDPMIPAMSRVTSVRRELADVWTLEIEPGVSGFEFEPGQFNMLYAFGVGEAAISISGDPAEPDKLVHTIRAVGKVSSALAGLKVGDPIGVRGPFGAGWPVEEAEGADVVVIAGGLGLAPLRPALYRLFAQRKRYGRVILLSGARSPHDLLFRLELERWRRRLDLDIEVTVDHADARLARQCRRGDDAHQAGELRSGAYGGDGLRAGNHDALLGERAGECRCRAGIDLSLHGAQHEMRHRSLRPLPVRRRLRLQGWSGGDLRPSEVPDGPQGDLT